MTTTGPQKFPGALTDHFFQNTFGGTEMETNVIVWHSTEGTSLPGYQNGAIAPNFTAVPDFTREAIVWHQHFDFDVSSRALKNLKGGVETNRLNVAQVELVGTCDPKLHTTLRNANRNHLFTEDLPDWVIRDLAAFARWAHDHHDVPLTSEVTWKGFDASFGAHNGVRLSGEQWRKFTGHLGHQHVPENEHGDPGAFRIEELLKLAGHGPTVTSTTHLVKHGETMFGIAQANGLTLQQLIAANPSFAAHPEMLPTGTVLVIPATQ